MEHLAHFGLSQDPFRNEAQLDFYFESAVHCDVRQRLMRCVLQGKELSLLIGDVGTGKTTLSRALFEELDPERFEPVLLVLARGVEPEWLRSSIARQLGVEAPASDRAEAVRELYQRLVEIREEGRRTVVLIDEANALVGAACLAELRSLLNFEHDEERLLSLVLVGSKKLDRILADDAELNGRTEVRIELGPLCETDAVAYLAHRIRAVGGEPAILDAAVAMSIAERATGIPRRLNALADNTLFEAHLAGRPRATLEDVEAAARDLPWAKGSAPAVEPAAPSAPPAVHDVGVDPAPVDHGWQGPESISAATPPTLAQAPAATPASVPLDATNQTDRQAVEDAVDAAFDGAAPPATRPVAQAAQPPTPALTELPAEGEPLANEDEIDGLFVDLVDEGS